MAASFIPSTYVAPTTGGSDYTKLQDGANSLRILSENPLMGFVYWNTANKPVRSEQHPGTPTDARIGQDGKADKVKEFWAMSVYNIATGKVEIWEVTQAQIKEAILNLSRDADWGHPSGYSLKITKSGKGLDTKYSVVPGKPGPLPADVQAVVDATPINLRALIDGGNPFDNHPAPGTAAPAPAKAGQPVPAGDVDEDQLPF